MKHLKGKQKIRIMWKAFSTLFIKILPMHYYWLFETSKYVVYIVHIVRLFKEICYTYNQQKKEKAWISLRNIVLLHVYIHS
jgi:hypothetical protein